MYCKLASLEKTNLWNKVHHAAENLGSSLDGHLNGRAQWIAAFPLQS